MRTDNHGVAIHYEVLGEGTPVVLLHGFPDSGRLWRHQMRPLADAGFRAIVPDLRGYGGSDEPVGVEHYNVLLVAADIGAVLDAEGVSRAHVVGHDWANFLSLWRHPDADDVIARLEANGSLTPGLNYYRANVPLESYVAPPVELPPVTGCSSSRPVRSAACESQALCAEGNRNFAHAISSSISRISLRHVLPVHLTVQPVNDDRLVLCL